MNIMRTQNGNNSHGQKPEKSSWNCIRVRLRNVYSIPIQKIIKKTFPRFKRNFQIILGILSQDSQKLVVRFHKLSSTLDKCENFLKAI